jgi:hypothetical protein
LQYGSGWYYTDWAYSFNDTGDYRLFTYYGGKSAKKTKRQCAQIFDVSVSGDASDADASIVPYSYNTGMVNYYRKIPVKKLRTTSLPDYRVYKKDTFGSGLGAESWASSGISFFSNDYAWITYGYSADGQYHDLAEGTYRICFPEKVSKSRNHVKRYIFSVSGDEENADISINYSSTKYYYRKVLVPGLKTDNIPNMRLVKKANFVSGFSEEAWTGGSYHVENGFIYILYGYRTSFNNTYYDVGTGNYRLFIYK